VPTLLDTGEATTNLDVAVRAGTSDASSDEQDADPRFRLWPLGAGASSFSLYRRQRWEPLPLKGRREELADDWS